MRLIRHLIWAAVALAVFVATHMHGERKIAAIQAAHDEVRAEMMMELKVSAIIQLEELDEEAEAYRALSTWLMPAVADLNKLGGLDVGSNSITVVDRDTRESYQLEPSIPFPDPKRIKDYRVRHPDPNYVAHELGLDGGAPSRWRWEEDAEGMRKARTRHKVRHTSPQ